MERLIENLPHLFALGALMVISGAISGSETALFALTRKQLTELAASGGIGARMVVRLRDQPRSLLSTVLLSNTAVNILLYSILGVTSVRLAAGSPVWTGFFGVSGFVLTVFGAEIIPKQIALALSMRLAPLVAIPLRVLEVASAPLRWLLENVFVEPFTRLLTGTADGGPAVSAEELQELVLICQNDGLIDDRENVILHHVVELSETRVSALMVPRVDFVAFDISDRAESLAARFKSSRLLHIPVYEGNIDNIIGVIHAREFFLARSRHAGKEIALRELIRPVHFIPEQAGVEALLQHFRRTGTQMAVVVDEYGGLAGVIALEDVVEAVVGDLSAPDEPAQGPPLVLIDDTTYLVDARIDVDDFRRAFQLPVEDTRIDTVGGLIAEQLGRLPVVGDTVTLGHATLRVESIRKRRVLRARLTLSQPAEENADLAMLLGFSREGSDVAAAEQVSNHAAVDMPASDEAPGTGGGAAR